MKKKDTSILLLLVSLSET